MIGDLVGYVALRAARDYFGGHDGMFNAAAFSAAWQQTTGLRSELDGRAVQAMLWGRTDVERVGMSHYRALAAGKEPSHG